MGDDQQQARSSSVSKRFRAWLLAATALLLILLALVFFLLPVAPTHSESEPGTSPATSSRQPLSKWLQQLAARQAATSAEPEIPWRLLTYPPPPCRSHGFVRWQDGSAASGAEIISLETPKHRANENTWVHTGSFSDEEGRYELPHQESCSVRLGAVIPGRGRGEESAAPVGDDEESPYMIRRDIVLDDAVRLHGVVVDELGEPVPGAAVCATLSWTLDLDRLRELETTELVEASGRTWANATITDPSGAFGFSAMEPGEWTVVIEADDFDRGLFDVLLDPAEPADPQEYAMSPDRCWHILVQDEAGIPIEGATVEVTQVNWTCAWRGNSIAPQVHFTGLDGVVEECYADAGQASIMAFAPGRTKVFFQSEEVKAPFVVTLPGSGAIAGRLSPYSQGDCPCSLGGRGALSLALDVEDDGSFFIDHVADGMERGGIYSEYGSWLGTYPSAVRGGAVLDLGVVELERRRVPPEVAHARPSWSPLGR